MSQTTKNKLTLEQKLSKHFGVKIAQGGGIIKNEDDADSRTIKAIGNTYFFIDSDQDMLVPGCCNKSIADRGPQSNAVAKIKHQRDHEIKTTAAVGRIDVLKETVIEDKTVLYFESYIPETRKGDDDLENYKAGLFDNHSIGFRYKQLVWAEKDSINEVNKKAWDEYYPQAINPEKADVVGGFWVIKEIELFEISVVSFGANQLTPYLGSKSIEENNKLKTELIERIDNLAEQLKSPGATKESRKNTEIEVLQLKQIISDLKLIEPSKKSTGDDQPDNTDTKQKNNPPKQNNLLTSIAQNL